MQKRMRGFLILVTTLAIALVVAGCASHNGSPKVTVTTAVASQQELETQLEFSGVLVPARTVDIASKIGGQVTVLGFKVGSPVKAGDILVQLDTDSLNAQLLSAQAGLQAAQASVQSAANQAAVSATNLAAAQKNYDRTKALFEAGAVSQSQLDDAQNNLNNASQQYATASGPAQAQAAAALTTASANIKNLNVQIGNATIRSPLDGTISNQNINLGQIAAPNVVLISIVDTSALKLKTTVGQDKLAFLSLGQAVNISTDSYPDRVFSGTVTSIGPVAVSTGEVFPLEITLPNQTGLLAGLSAHATVTGNIPGLIIPTTAILQDNGASYVYVIANNTASRRVIKIGLKNDKEVQILDGLSAGDQVAITNLSVLTDGMAVNVQ